MLGLDGVPKRVEAVVATYPCAQTPILEEFGHQAKLCCKARSANGCVIEGKGGEVAGKIDGVYLTTVVTFGDPDSETAGNTVTLEDFLLATVRSFTACPDGSAIHVKPCVGKVRTSPWKCFSAGPV
jgi:hypothetical protein